MEDEADMLTSEEETINTLISTVYSGPTIQDIDDALLYSTPKHRYGEFAQFRFVFYFINERKVS